MRKKEEEENMNFVGCDEYEDEDEDGRRRRCRVSGMREERLRAVISR
ncbi:hypothetical protein JI435_418500 [Parastagonospora nodorum SN15]|nr:hypothetical protein JI435_418500 [Parastagonospora nodorum SN15]